MRPASPALQSYLAANDTFVVIDLYTFALTSGTVLYYSGWTTPLTIPGTAFASGSLNYNATGYTSFALGPRFDRSMVSTKIGIEPTELDISILAGANDLVGGSSFADAVRVGQFDGATVELDRFFAPAQAAGSGAPATSLGAVVWFYGRVAETDVGRSKIEMKVKSLLNLLAQQQMPRRLYQAACTHVFGDAMCSFNRASLAATTTAQTGSTQAAIVTTLSPSPSTLYDQGTIIATSGANAGQSRRPRLNVRATSAMGAQSVNITDLGSATLTVAANSGQTIDNASSVALATLYQALRVIYIGSNEWVIA
jgi:hypothetical protein